MINGITMMNVNPEAKYLDPNNYIDYPDFVKINEWLIDLEKQYNQTYTEFGFINFVEYIQNNRNKSPQEIYRVIKSLPDAFNVEAFSAMYRHAKALLAIHRDHELSNFIYVKKDTSDNSLESKTSYPSGEIHVIHAYNKPRVAHLQNDEQDNDGPGNKDEVVISETIGKPTLSKTDELRKDTIRKYLEAGNDFLSKLPFDVEVVRDFQDRELIDLWEQHLAYLKVESIARGYD